MTKREQLTELTWPRNSHLHLRPAGPPFCLSSLSQDVTKISNARHIAARNREALELSTGDRDFQVWPGYLE